MMIMMLLLLLPPPPPASPLPTNHSPIQILTPALHLLGV